MYTAFVGVNHSWPGWNALRSFPISYSVSRDFFRLRVWRAPGSTVVPSHGSPADLTGNIQLRSSGWSADVGIAHAISKLGSSNNPRIWLMTAVRRITPRSRTRCRDCRSRLVIGLNRHKAHCRPCHSLCDRLRIDVVALVGLNVWLHILRRYPRPFIRFSQTVWSNRKNRTLVPEFWTGYKIFNAVTFPVSLMKRASP